MGACEIHTIWVFRRQGDKPQKADRPPGGLQELPHPVTVAVKPGRLSALIPPPSHHLVPQGLKKALEGLLEKPKDLFPDPLLGLLKKLT
ncbi:MAG: hypothetical protein DRG40_00915 [Deltaproteobacteria bacterium]|nr:MAG: hypothetical protein DRG40_00915 [Deltaproteobacteria bacterium]